MGTTLRRLSPDDWVLWRELRLLSLADAPDAFGSTLRRETAFTEAEWRQRLTSMAVIAFVDDVAAALGGAFRPEEGLAHIIAMWTAPEFRHRGLASLILDTLVAAARAEGRQVVLDVARTNDGARRLYQARGFEPTGKVAPLREGCDLLVDELALPGWVLRRG